MSLNQNSFLDHVFTVYDVDKPISSVNFLNASVNTSDHLPVCISLKFPSVSAVPQNCHAMRRRLNVNIVCMRVILIYGIKSQFFELYRCISLSCISDVDLVSGLPAVIYCGYCLEIFLLLTQPT